MDVGFWSLVPPLLTIALAIITKEVLLSLIIGVYAGCLIVADLSPFGAFQEMINLIVGKLTTPWNMEVLVLLIMLGGLIGIMIKSGGSIAFGNWISSKIHSRKGVQGTAWGIGLLIFFDDYFNCLTNGAIMRPVCDNANVSREKFSYLIDSTAVGICLIAPVSSWAAFISSVIAESFHNYKIDMDAFQAFLQAIPYNFYALLSMLMVACVIIFGIDFGPMAKAELRTKTTGQLCDATFSGGESDEDDFSAIEVSAGKPYHLLIPILSFIAFTVIFMLYTGGFFKHFDVLDAISNMDGMISLVYAVFLSVLIAIILSAITKVSSISESFAAFVIGGKSMVFVILLLTLAWSIGGVCDKLATGSYVAELLQGNVPNFIVPVIIYIFSYLITFSTGATWGTFAIMIPVAVPMALAIDPHLLFVYIAASLAGGGGGAHCSPIADTSILSSCAANIKLVDHIKTQAPYSLTISAIACIGYALVGAMNTYTIP
ncbi:MAG: Na+/H+ antiporter NhaC family protein, partial [Anaerovorax sp.]